LENYWTGIRLSTVPFFESGDITRDASDDAIGAIFDKSALGILKEAAPSSYREERKRRRAWELGFVSEYIAFEMDDDGIMVRLGPPELAPVLKNAVFNTGDDALDGFLEGARERFTDPDLKVRKESLEKIWDAFERLKTIEQAKDKKASIMELLTKGIAEPEMRERVDKEMTELTDIGNKFMIRHTEMGRTPITKSEQVDYMFQRIFSVVRLLLKATNRGG
jgi:hypothetical protein